MVDVTSLQPKNPGVLHVLVEVGRLEVVVTVGAGEAVVDDVVLDEVVVVESLHPNHPGVSQVVLEIESELEDDDDDELESELEVVVVVDSLVVVVVVDVVDIPELVVVSSKHPNHPGVKHVSVRVLVRSAELLLVVLVIGSVPLLSKKFQA